MTVMIIERCVCRKIIGEKDGQGSTGVMSGLHDSCALTLLPAELHDEYRRRKQLADEGLTFSADRVAMGKCW